MKGVLEIQSKIIPGMIHIGYGEVGIFDRKRERSVWNVRGKIIFKGNCYLGHGTKINITETGIVTFGHKVNFTAESAIDCQREISFGDECLISWENLFLDGDYHKVFDENGNLTNQPQSIHIGQHVWIGCRCLILKGTVIPDNCIISAGAVLKNVYTICNSIIAGSPGKVVKENISWQV
jgi:acetyltransferase-like isoleucine patch superfamily enzyme